MTFPSELPATAPSQRSLAVETILVVDDHPELCHIAALLLGRVGYRVLTADSGEQAREIARHGADVDLLLTDVEMPGMSGDELAAWFRGVRPNMPIVFMSGNPAQFERLKPRFFVEKPFIHLDLLVGTIREALLHGRSMPAISTAA
jgi:two-component system cell cycle sensor histidine kinase/response regulator CckA